MAARLVDPGLPVSVEVYRGNLNDPPRYADSVPRPMLLLKKGSVITMDDGGSAKDLPDDIEESGNDHPAGKRMNRSDADRIRENTADAVHVGDGTMRIEHDSESSGKTNRLCSSVDRCIPGAFAVERRIRMAEKLEEALGDPKPERTVEVRRNPFYKVEDVKCGVGMTLNPWLEEDAEKAIGETRGDDRGRFKLQCSERLPAREALELYRHRAAAESPISPIESMVGLKPPGVRSESSTGGAVLPAVTARLMISMVGYDMEPDAVGRTADGSMRRRGRR